MHSLCSKCKGMRNISRCNIIDKSAAKYFTHAKYFTGYDQCRAMQNISLCNVIDKTAAKYFTQAKYLTDSLCMMKLQGVHYALFM